MTKIKYRVHQFEARGGNTTLLENFLNTLEGDVISILPSIKKNSLAQILGITARVDFLMIVEKI